MQSKRVLRQQDRFRILGDLAGVIPHDIKNALVPLRTLGDLLPDRYNNPDFRAWYANTVRREAWAQDVVDGLRRLEEKVAGFRPDRSTARFVGGLTRSDKGDSVNLGLYGVYPFSMSSSDTLPPLSPGIGMKRSRKAAPGSHPIRRMDAIG